MTNRALAFSLAQKNDMLSCTNSFGMLLSSLETYLRAIKYSIPVQFAPYDHFEGGRWKNPQQLLGELRTGILGYKIQKMAYQKKYKRFDYPEEPPIQLIYNTINGWRGLAQQRGDTDTFNLLGEILGIINDTNTSSIHDLESRVPQTRKEDKMDVDFLVNASNTAHQYIDKNEAKLANEFARNPNTKIGLQMGSSHSTDPTLSKIKPQVPETHESYYRKEEIKKARKKIVDLITDILNLAGKYLTQDFTYVQGKKMNIMDVINQEIYDLRILLEQHKNYENNYDFIWKYYKQNNIKKDCTYYINELKNDGIAIKTFLDFQNLICNLGYR